MKDKPYLEIRNVLKTFGRFTALDRVCLDVRERGFLCLLGPSGCGKTTLLRIVAGLEEPDEGSIVMGGRDITKLSTARRNFGMVFQSYALFPNMTAYDNIAYGLKNRKLNKSEIRDRVMEAARVVGLEENVRKFPAQLSGGQQQRVALARVLVLSPSLLLLDEPLSALDAKVRLKLRDDIRRLHERIGVTTIMVTHDQEEALSMADQIAVIDRGRIMQVGSPEEIYERPANPFVADFIGTMNFIEHITPEDRHFYRIVRARGGKNAGGPKSDAGSVIAVRPEHIRLSPARGGAEKMIPVKVLKPEFRGSFYRLKLELPAYKGAHPARTVEADFPSELVHRLGIGKDTRVNIMIPEKQVVVF
jgi:iron(III) transport system ATP-binding protein